MPLMSWNNDHVRHSSPPSLRGDHRLHATGWLALIARLHAPEIYDEMTVRIHGLFLCYLEPLHIRDIPFTFVHTLLLTMIMDVDRMH